MKNFKNLAKGFLLLSFLAGAVISAPVYADNDSRSDSEDKNYLNARAAIHSQAFLKAESAVGVILGANNSLRVMGAKVESVSGSDIKASVPFGNASLNFTVKADAASKLNGKVAGSAYATVIDDLKAGDKISFAGTITSSSSSSIVVDGDHIVARALYNDEVKSNDDDKDNNDDDDEDGEEDEDKDERKEERKERKSERRNWFAQFRSWFK